MWGAVVLSCYPLLAGWDSDLPATTRWLIVFAILGSVGGVATALGGLTVAVQETRVFVHLGRVPLIRTAVPFAQIVDCAAVEYRPIAEFGGWGLRGTKQRRMWSARGNRAVRLDLADGRVVFLGSDHPQRLEERIRTLGKDQFFQAG